MNVTCSGAEWSFVTFYQANLSGRFDLSFERKKSQIGRNQKLPKCPHFKKPQNDISMSVPTYIILFMTRDQIFYIKVY